MTPRIEAAKYCLLAFLALAALPAVAQRPLATQDLAAIERAAADEIRRQAPGSLVEIQPLDRRLQLTACDEPLQAALPANSTVGARVTVRVACAAGWAQWSVSVPATVSAEAPVVVSTRAIPPGATIGADDVRAETRRFPGTVRCCATTVDAVVGLIARRGVAAEAIVTLDALDRPPAVKRGEVVVVLAALPGVEIRSSGVALADARAGETVRIRHSTSLKVIQARADTPGVVRVDR